MYRTRMIVAAFAIASLSPLPANAQNDALKPGGTFEGEIKTNSTQKQVYLLRTNSDQRRGQRFFGSSKHYYETEVPIALKAGQGLSVSVSVTGSGRKVVLFLRDPTRLEIAETSKSEVKSNELTVEEVNATGTFYIVVLSDQSGQFTLKTAGPKDDDADQLRAKVARLKKELADAEARLKALEARRREERGS